MEVDLDELEDVQQDQTAEETSEIETDKLQNETTDKPNKTVDKTGKSNESHLVQITASNEEAR